MRFGLHTAPHWRTETSIPAMMREVLAALAPAGIAYVYFFGPGLVLNIVVASVFALATEYAALRLRTISVRPFLTDGSAIVSAVLLAFCLPPLTPWWVTATGVVFAIGGAKHLFGGLGLNLFNPAMAGYVVVLAAFPAAMTNWLPPQIGDLDYRSLSLIDHLHFTATGHLPEGLALDSITRATPLTVIRTELAGMRTLGEIVANPVFGDFGGRGWEWIGNFATLGGLWLMLRGIIRWQVPCATLASLLTAALLMHLWDAETAASPLLHLYAGGTLLGAFFIATDPVSSAVTGRGRLLYGTGIGLLTYAIRAWGNLPDGFAYAVLTMNMAVPLIDRYSRPRIYGHESTDG